MIESWNKEGGHSISNIIYCLLLVLIGSVQLLIVVVLIFYFIPIHISPVIQTLFPRYRELVFPKRDLFFYRFWVGSLIVGQVALLGILKDKLKSQKLEGQLRLICQVEAGWLFLMVFAVFEIFVYGYPAWGFDFLYVIIGASVLSKVFWKELQGAFRSGLVFVNGHLAAIIKAADIIFPLVIIAMIFVPDLQGALARMWIGDCLHHWDTTLMAQAWCYINGGLLNVDIYAHYGLGMPIFIALLAKGLGIFSYTGVLSILIWSVIIYFILCYFFLRVWLKSVPIAIAGILIAIKWQMCHPENYPFIFTYPYSTVCRYFFDIFLLFLILAHIRQGKFYFLIAAGAICSLALFWVSDTGVYLTLAYVFYVCWLVIEGLRDKKILWKDTLRPALIAALTVPVGVFIFLFIFEGSHAFSKEFWGNLTEQIQLFLVGEGDLPMYKSLIEGDYLSSLVSFIIPLVYGAVLMAIASLCFLKKINRQNMMAAVLCVYGMGLYHYYVCRSSATSYYSVCIPFVFVLCWLCLQAGKLLTSKQARGLRWTLLVMAALALFSNHAFLSYPNILNFSPNPYTAPIIKWPNKNLPFYFNNIPRSMSPNFKLSANSLGVQDEDLRIETDFKNDVELKEYFKSEFAFSEDSALIDHLTSPGSAVPLISSFETRILMQADRKPFFYYFPLVGSRPMHMRMFPFTTLETTHRLSVTIQQLEDAKPPYVFMEKILLAREVPKIYELLYPELIYILEYVDKNYQPYKFGKYLVALKRI